jgi:acyl-coenzyme A synthetase/AMP-(fatty) acid ligase
MIDSTFFLSGDGGPPGAHRRRFSKDSALRVVGFLQGSREHPGTLAIRSRDTETIAVCSIGAWLAGWCVLIVPPEWTPDYAEILTRNADLLVDDDDAAAGNTVPQAALLAGPAAAPGDGRWEENRAALVLPTSGSTGAAKGVCHSLGNLVRSAGLFAEHFELTPGQRLICLAPPHTMSGMRSLVLPFVSDVAVTHFCDPALSGLQLASAVFEAAPDYVLCGPAFVSLLAKAAPLLRRLETKPGCFLVTGAALNEDHRRTVEREFGTPVANFYGLTETGGICAAERLGTPLYHCLPPACEGIGLTLRSVEGEAVLKEVLVETPNAFLGYLGGPLGKPAFVATGDLVEVESNGNWRMSGRIGRALKARSTGWIHPEAVEAWLKGQPHVADAAATANHGSDGGPVLEAWIEWAESDPAVGRDPDHLLDAMRRELAPENLPARIFPARIRRSALGKILAIEKI